MKKNLNLPNKTFHSNNSSEKPLLDNYNEIKKSSYRDNYRGRSPD